MAIFATTTAALLHDLGKIALPAGLAGEHIPCAARIIRVTEAYQAMTTDRPYQQHRSGEEARAELLRCAGTHFDPAIVEAALAVLSSGKPAMNETRSRPASSSSAERARPGEKSAARP